MFAMGRMVFGAVVWGVGASIGKDLYKKATGQPVDTERASLEARITQLEKEVARLQRTNAAG